MYHPQALADVIGFEIKRDEVTSLKRLLDHDIAAHMGRITELSDNASRSVHEAVELKS
jgi:dynein heavy chain